MQQILTQQVQELIKISVDFSKIPMKGKTVAVSSLLTEQDKKQLKENPINLIALTVDGKTFFGNQLYQVPESTKAIRDDADGALVGIPAIAGG